MKKSIICTVFLSALFFNVGRAQNIAINTDGSLPDGSAVLDVSSTSKGFLAPRMTTAQQNAIASPAKGLLIFNTTDNQFKVNTGTPASPVWTALTASSNNWLLTGNSGSNVSTNFLGTTDNVGLAFRTNNQQRMTIDNQGRVGIGVTNPANPLVVKDTMEIRRTAGVSQLLFSNTAGTGDFRIGGDGGDIFWQGGGGRNLQMGAYWGITLMGDRQNGTFPSFTNGVANTGVLVQAQRDASVPLAVQPNSATQSANLTEWRNASGTAINVVNNNGNMAIGSSTFNGTNPEKLLVDAGTTTSVNAIVGKGSINSYLQLNIQNQSNGTSASSDVVATANNGDETSNYVDMGINGGSYSGGVMGAANDGYLYTMGNNFLIGTGNANKSLVFMTGGTSQAGNERMRIDGNGNVGIGTTNPAYKLQVNASSNPLFLSGVQTGTGSDSLLTIQNGVVKRIASSALSGTSNWGLSGNASTNPSSNFIGTTDAQALVIKENNTQVGRFEANSIALGNGAAVNTATHSYAMGSGAAAAFGITGATAIGKNAAVNADNSLALGNSASTAFSITDAMAIGNSATANSTNAIVIGKNASTGFSLTNPVAIGVNSIINGSNSVAIGSNSNVGFNANATVIGAEASATSSATNSTAIGYNTDITKSNEIILGDMTNSSLAVGIGSENFSTSNREKLLVDAGTTTSVNAIVGKGSINSYLQLNIQNNSNGTSASSDVVATANNGDETSNYVDMGINGGSYNGGIMGAANDGYLYTMGNNFLIGTGNANKSLVFMTGGTSQASNERMRIDGSGNVGIGVTNPVYKLQVSSSANPLLLGGLQTGTSSDSVLTVSGGVVKRLNASALAASSNAWSLSGNTGSATAKLGTTGNFDLPVITNNTTKMTITADGKVGIGSTDFDGSQPEKLLVDAGTTTSSNLIGAYGEANTYLQIGVQNTSNGNSASSDIVATADNGTNTTNYIDMGINSSGYANNNSNILNRPNVGYLYTNATADFFIGNGAPNQDMIFFTNNGPAGNTTANGFEAIRIDGDGNVGIGGTSRNNSGVKTINPERLVVQGNIVPRTSGSGTIGTATYKWNAVYATNGTIQTSDRRMKTDINNLNYGLKEVMAMRPVSFYWKETPNQNKKVGLIAQEVQQIVPEVVIGNEAKDTLGLNYAELVPVLINAVQEQQKQIEELKNTVKKLQAGKN